MYQTLTYRLSQEKKRKTDRDPDAPLASQVSQVSFATILKTLLKFRYKISIQAF